MVDVGDVRAALPSSGVRLDVLIYAERAGLRLGEYSHRSPEEANELDLSADDLTVKASAPALCERLTGERLDGDWLHRRHRWLIRDEPPLDPHPGVRSRGSRTGHR